MEEVLKQVLSELQGLRNEVNERFDNVDKRLESMDNRFDNVDKRLENMDNRFDRLDQGQEELKELIKHTTTLMTENFTNIRKEIRVKGQDTQADIDLLFKEVEDVKRRTNKLEQKLNH